MHKQPLLYLTAMAALLAPLPSQAELAVQHGEGKVLTNAERMGLARQFVSLISKGLKDAERGTATLADTNAAQVQRLPDGENLLLGVRIEKKIPIDATILGRVENKAMLISLRDFISAVEFPITMDTETGNADGWYIREKNAFSLDSKARTVASHGGKFAFSDSVIVEDDDVMVPIDELASWFGFTLELNVAALEVNLESPTPLPVQERYARQQFKDRSQKIGPPVLPFLKEEPPVIDYPFVDVSNRAGYNKDGRTGNTRKTATSAIRTTGDLAGGTLTTQTLLEKEEKLDSIRLNYKKESLEPELLGPLKARKAEIGDVFAAPLPLRNFSGGGIGARVTNAHPYLSTLNASTEIRGSTFPGWDVELYRENQLLSFQRVGDDGQYLFENIDLFTQDNNFRVVLYGPQGEVREEEINIPVDTTRLAKNGGVYDVTVSAQDTQTFRKNKVKDEDVGAPAVTAIYEVPIGGNSALSAAFETGQRDGEQKYIGHAGVSTTLGGVLLNLDGAADEKGETAAQLVARRRFGEHEFRNEVKVSTDRYNLPDVKTNSITTMTALQTEQRRREESEKTTVFSEKLSITGPLPGMEELRPRYNLGLGYQLNADGNKYMDYLAGVSGGYKGVTLSQQLGYTSSDYEEDRLESLTTLTGSIGRTRLRFNSAYEIQPESELKRVSANVRRDIVKDVELDLTVAHRPNPKLTEGRAQINWDAGFASISPAVSYNTDKDIAATLNTRFSLARDPQSGKIRSYQNGITSNGSVSAFVFLDKNGDGIFNEGDEALPDVIVRAPQNGGREISDDDGYVFFKNMASMRPTDIYVDPDSLKDPFWIPGFQGVSVLPREGHVTPLQFPIHMGGEMDGTVFVRSDDGTSYPQRGVIVSLYDDAGKKVSSSISESDGFYLFQKIPPGQYRVAVDGDSFMNRFARPKPEAISIGYDGTVIYGKNIYLEEGQADVPIQFVADANDLELGDRWAGNSNVFLNLGSYKSRVSMALAWFKIRSYVGRELEGVELIQKPSDSVASTKGQNYTLRAAVKTSSEDKAYETCRSITSQGFTCAVEIVKAPLPEPEKIAAK